MRRAKISIIGAGKRLRSGEPGDGVVSVASASLAGVASEMMVNATHESLHREPATVAEIVRILRVHQMSVHQAVVSPGVTITR